MVEAETLANQKVNV